MNVEPVTLLFVTMIGLIVVGVLMLVTPERPQKVPERPPLRFRHAPNHGPPTPGRAGGATSPHGRR